MKHFGTVATLLIVAFFATMNTLVVLRERNLASLGQYQVGINKYLGQNFLRERWLAVYRKDKDKDRDKETGFRERYVGYTGYTLEKRFDGDAIAVWQTLDSRVSLPLIGDLPLDVRLSGTLEADAEMIPKSLRLKLTISGFNARILGQRVGGKFRVEVQSEQVPSDLAPLRELALAKVELPLEELHLGDALAPSLPLAGLQVGDQLTVPYFNPLTRSRAAVNVKVLSKEVREVSGVNVDAYRLETTLPGMPSSPSYSWVTEAGDVLIQELGKPLDGYVLKRTSKVEIDRRENK